MRDRLRASLIAILSTIVLLAAAVPAHAVVAPPKVVIIVGPVGSITSSYRTQADDAAAAAVAAGAVVTKVYSPNATWPAVKAAVSGANVIIYFGHGNGYPNPYSTTYYPDRVDGWGLNTATTNGDADSWSAGTLVYCGEKALLGTLTSTDGAAQRTYCSGGPITPAPGFVMIYSDACYAPGASEPGTTAATASQALQRVSYYSRPVLSGLGASGYFATDQGAARLVTAILANPGTTYGDLYTANLPTGLTVTDNAHLFITGDRVRLGLRTTDPYYTYAFAGDPTRTFGAGATALSASDTTAPTIVSRSPTTNATGVTMTPVVSVRFSEPVIGVSANNMVLRLGTTVVSSTVAYDSSTTTATLRPLLPLAPAATYSVALSSRIHDAAGNTLAWTSWKFTTARSEVYNPARTLAFSAGTYTGYRFSSTGAVTASKTGTLSRASSAPTSQRSAIAGQSGAWYYVTAGIWGGYWVRESTAITLQ